MPDGVASSIDIVPGAISRITALHGSRLATSVFAVVSLVGKIRIAYAEDYGRNDDLADLLLDLAVHIDARE